MTINSSVSNSACYLIYEKERESYEKRNIYYIDGGCSGRSVGSFSSYS